VDTKGITYDHLTLSSDNRFFKEKHMAKKATTGTSKFMQPMQISSELAEVVGKGPMPRTEVTKKLWAYIKKHNRQDPENKRNIIPDDKLAKVFGSKRAINMFDMTKKVNKHLS
jgi:chromatin remodeling complex protein RSC6